MHCLPFLLASLMARPSSAFATVTGSHGFRRDCANRYTHTGTHTSKANAFLEVRGGALHLGPSEAWSAYNQALEAYPLAVKSLTAGVILGAADLTGQALEYSKRDVSSTSTSTSSSSSSSDMKVAEETSPPTVDVARAVRFAVFGLVLQAPWNHFYYNILDGVLPPTQDPFTATTAIKTIIDQFVQAPIFTVLIFAFLGALEGKGVEQIQNQLEENYKDTIIANCKWLW